MGTVFLASALKWHTISTILSYRLYIQRSPHRTYKSKLNHSKHYCCLRLQRPLHKLYLTSIFSLEQLILAQVSPVFPDPKHPVHASHPPSSTPSHNTISSRKSTLVLPTRPHLHRVIHHQLKDYLETSRARMHLCRVERESIRASDLE